MKRRTFLKAAAMAGAAASAPAIFRQTARAQEVYSGPYWLFVNAAGGWDPQFMFDPTDNSEHRRIYSGTPSIGNISYAPIGLDWELLEWDSTLGIEEHIMTAEQFLTAHGDKLTVVNGIDTTTNSHDGGQQIMGSGQLTASYPAIGALIAAAKAPTMPMSFFSGGGYDVTGGHIPLTRVSNADSFQRIARPNEISAGEPETDLYHTAETMARIRSFQQARNEALRDRQRLPKLRIAMQDLLNARLSTGVLDRVELPEELIDLPQGELNDLEGFMRQGQLLMASFKSGLSATGSINFGGWDTHGNHDRDHSRKVVKLFGGIDFLIQEAGRQGLADKLYIVATSDFGRGPHYNGEGGGSGKDHWPISSMFALGPGIAGNRMIGGTDNDQLARRVDPDSLELSDDGIKLGPEHVHRALRAIAGMDDAPFMGEYPLPGEDLALFG